MRTLRQIEESFRQLDRKEGRINPYYEKSKLEKADCYTNPHTGGIRKYHSGM